MFIKTNNFKQKYPIFENFLNLSIVSFYDALEYVHQLPYGGNINRNNYLSILEEKKGTCSITHTLIY